MMEEKFSVFEYLYRDASNYKVWGTLLLRGEASADDVAALQACMDLGEYFVAEQIGIPVLYEELFALSGGATEDDHDFHEFFALREATSEEIAGMDLWGDLTRLLAKFRLA